MEQLVELFEDLVTFPAQGGLVAKEEGAVFRGVGSVAVGATAVRNRFVDHGTVIDHAVVALLAQPFGWAGQKFSAVGRVGVVADQAAVLIDDTVKLALHEIPVAFGTQIGPGLDEKRSVLRRVGIVAVHASPVSGRFVGHRFRSGIIVAADT